MRHIRNTLLAISWLLALAAPALAQSNPGLAYGQIPTAAQWNSFFSAKTDYPGYTPIGPSNVLATAPITATVAGQNVTIACATCVTNPYGSLLVINGVTIGGAIITQVRTATSTTDNINAVTDYFVCADNSAGAATENLPASPKTGLTFLIKDCGGHAATYNITVSPAAGNIDGATTLVLSNNYQSIAVTYTGSQWSGN